LEGCDQKDHGSRPAGKNTALDPVSKIITAKWTGDVAQAIARLLCKGKPNLFKPNFHKKEKKEPIKTWILPEKYTRSIACNFQTHLKPIHEYHGPRLGPLCFLFHSLISSALPNL
jgi:hypothetical protein